MRVFLTVSWILVTTAAAAGRAAALPPGDFPVSFEANRGQVAPAVRFFSRCPGYDLFLTGKELVLSARGGSEPVRIELVGADLSRPDGEARSARKSHYFLGADPARWITEVPHFERVVCREAYPGVDLVLRVASSAIEYDLVLAPAAGPESITLRFGGADRLELDDRGDLLIQSAGGALRQRRPVVYQESGGTRTTLRGGYELLGQHEVRFRIADSRDPSLPLVIDPILVYSTFLGTPVAEGITDIAVDAFASPYVTGFTSSPDFPVKAPFQDAPGAIGQISAFVTKLSPTGRDIVYSTYLGGAGVSWGEGIAVDSQGRAIIAGWTDAADFPRRNAVRPGPAGGADAFVTRLGAGGNELVHSTLFGGTGDDKALDLAVDLAGEICVTGETSSTNFPAIHARDATLGGTKDAFAFKLDATGDAVVYSTYLGGGGKETARGIAADFDGNAYVAGETDSTDFPVEGGIQGSIRGTRDAFVTKLAADGSSLVYSTYLGGDGGDDAWAIAVDGLENAYVAGRGSGGFPLKASLFPALGNTLLFLTKLRPDGADTVYSTLLGANVTGIPESVAIGAFGDVFVTGWAAYFGDGFSQFPKRGPPLQETFGGGTGDVFLLRLDSSGGFFRFASFIGGTQGEEAAGIALGERDEAYIAGLAFSAGFPTTLGAFDRMLDGQNDGFIARVDTDAYPDDPPYLTLGAAKPASLTALDPQGRFRVVIPPGLRAVITVTGSDPADSNALYVRYGLQPEPFSFDQASEARGASSQRIVIPATQAGECHVLVQANVIHGPSSDVTVRADAFDLALERISPRRAASGSSVSASVHGGGFGPDTNFRLEPASGGSPVPADAIRVVSSERAEMTFDLGGASIGAHRLVAEEPGGETAELDDALDVVKRLVPGVLLARISSPDSCRLSRHARVTVEYENAGDVEIPARILRLAGPSSVEMRVEGEADFQKGSVQALAVNPDGPADRLPPGAAGSISIEIRGNTEGTIEIGLDAFAPNLGDFIGWNTLAAPPGFGAAWKTTWPTLSAVLGASWLDYEATLGRIAARLARRGLTGAPVMSVRQLFRSAVMEADGGFPGSAIAGQAIRSPANAPLVGKTVLALENGQVRSSAVTDSRGFFALQCLEPGSTYELAMSLHDTADAEVTLPANGDDVLGRELRAVFRSNGRRAAPSSCDGFHLPGGPLALPKGLATRIASRKIRIVRSSDPNEKDGPDGEGPRKLIGVRDEVLYTIHFENVATATAAAQGVAVTDQLDPDLDWSTFRMREFGVGEHLVSLDTGGASGTQLARDGYGGTRTESGVTLGGRYTGVEVRCDFDPLTGLARWSFATVDPATGDRPPLFVSAGFLPPNTQPPAGEGWVSFTVQPKPDLAEGTEIKNESSIQFDNLAPQTTGVVTNVISLSLFTLGTPANPFPADDVTRPVEVDGLYLSWDGDPRTDGYDVLFWKDGEAFPSKPSATGLTAAFFSPTRKIEHGATYHWQVVANGGRSQVRKSAEWSFRTVDADPPTPGISQLSSPEQGATGVETTPELNWKPAARADVYEVALWPHAQSRPARPLVSGISGTTFNLTGALDAGTRHDWQVTAINRAGRTASGVGTFTTSAPAGKGFRRGDANGDGKPDISDASYVLGYLFLGNPRSLPCAKSADANDDGVVNISDPTALLGYLFLGTTPALRPPFESCGQDPTPDALTCTAFPACP